MKKIFKFIFKFTPNLKFRIILLRLSGYYIGENVYIPSTTIVSDKKNHDNNLHIGNRVSLGPNVTLITDSSPNNSKLLKIFPLISKKIILEDDVWLGSNVTILPGVIIGKCSVIGSGAVVTKSIPPYSVVAGVPAKIIRKINPNEL